MPPIQFKRLDSSVTDTETRRHGPESPLRNAPKRNVKQQCLQFTSFELNTLTLQ